MRGESRIRSAFSISKKMATSTTVSAGHASSLKHGGLIRLNEMKANFVVTSRVVLCRTN